MLRREPLKLTPMREPSSRGIRGPRVRGRGCLLALLALAGMFGARDAGAQAITRYVRDTGNINFVTTGGTLRNSATTTCTLNATSTQTLSGIPAGTTIRGAYLYWGGSGATAAYNDTTVTLNGTGVTASRTFARTWINGATSYPFFGDFANVTSIVNAAGGNGHYTFGGLTVNTGTPHSGNSTCAGGWALIVIYESATERLRAINVFDGLDYFYGSSLTLTPDGFRVPPTNIDGRIAVFTLDGDPGNSTSLQRRRRGAALQRHPARRRPRAGGQRPDRAAVRRHHQHVGRRDQLRRRRRPVRHQRLARSRSDQRHHAVFGRRRPGAAHGAGGERHLGSGGEPRRDHVAQRQFRGRQHRPVHHHRVERPRAWSARTTPSR